MNLKDAGSAKMAPYLAMFAFSNLGGWAGDHLITQRAYPVAAGRKAINTLGVPCRAISAASSSGPTEAQC